MLLNFLFICVCVFLYDFILKLNKIKKLKECAWVRRGWKSGSVEANREVRARSVQRGRRYKKITARVSITVFLAMD